MKIKQIEAILKAEKTIIVSETPSCQWLGNGSAFYPVYNLPKLTRENIFTMFDIPEDKRDKFYFEERELPSFINFEDDDDTERMIDRGTMALCAHGRTLEPLDTSQGVTFINTRYLKPFADVDAGYELYERVDKLGRPYIAVKTGFVLLGVISPYDLVNEEFIKTLENLITRVFVPSASEGAIQIISRPKRTSASGAACLAFSGKSLYSTWATTPSG